MYTAEPSICLDFAGSRHILSPLKHSQWTVAMIRAKTGRSERSGLSVFERSERSDLPVFERSERSDLSVFVFERSERSDLPVFALIIATLH